MFRYASIGAVLMSKRVADGIRDEGGFWKHGHTYQVGFALGTSFGFSHAGHRHTRFPALRLWPSKESSRSIDC